MYSLGCLRSREWATLIVAAHRTCAVDNGEGQASLILVFALLVGIAGTTHFFSFQENDLRYSLMW